MAFLDRFLGNASVIFPFLPKLEKHGVSSLDILCAMSAQDLHACEIPMGSAHAIFMEIQCHVREQKRRRESAEASFLVHLGDAKYVSKLLVRLQHELKVFVGDGCGTHFIIPSAGDLLFPRESCVIHRDALKRPTEFCNKVEQFLRLCDLNEFKKSEVYAVLKSLFVLSPGSTWYDLAQKESDLSGLESSDMTDVMEYSWGHSVDLDMVLSALPDALRVNAPQTLHILWRLRAREKDMAEVFQRRLEEEVQDLVKTLETHGWWDRVCSRMDSWCSRHEAFSAMCFDQKAPFREVITRVLHMGMQQLEDRIPLWLPTRFIHLLESPPTDFHAQLDPILRLYTHLLYKSEFENHVHLSISKLLLEEASLSEEFVMNTMMKFKCEGNGAWLHKIRGMIRDRNESKNVMGCFRLFQEGETQKKKKKKQDMEFSMQICSTGHWPTYRSIPFHLPREFESVYFQFQQFYTKEYKDRKLIWQMDMGRAEVLVHFTPKRSATLLITTYQAMILMIFNTPSRVVTWKQVLEFTGVPANELAHHMLSLVHPKVAVLLKRPAKKELQDGDQFMLNPKFQSPTSRFLVPLMPRIPMESKTEDPSSSSSLFHKDIKLDTAILRIMKNRKKMRHPLLVAEVIHLLKDHPLKIRPHDVKLRIDVLIDDEYMKRDAADRSVYEYIP